MKGPRNAFLLLALCAPPLAAQDPGGRWQPQLEIAWNRYYDHAELHGIMERLRATWPGFVELRDIGQSHEGRTMRLLVLTNRATGTDEAKPAMWVDGNVHGNEVQGAEAALYLAWWLLEHRETNPRAGALLDERVFYILPSQNPDGRDWWFAEPNTASSSRSGKRPYDNDRDGLVDEDGADDLDGDGEIVTMRKRVPVGTGTHLQDPADPRVLIPARGKDRLRADWLMLGREGLDNDGDGRINEDGPGGYDMNRNWPSDWQPGHIQFGAGDYPFSYPETRAIGDFILAHPNIAAAQSFHNSGGMILMGPGDEKVRYPAADVRVYEEIGEEGETILPFYRLLIIWKDLYTVHGGFVNWVYEGLGVFAYSNELWASPQYFGGDRERPNENWFTSNMRNQLDFSDSVMLGDIFVDWHPVQHPLYGEVEVGGFKRQHGRVAPSFMIEEMLHRNAMFCLRHAEEIAEVAGTLESEDLGGGLARVRVELSNDRLMPSRSGMAAANGIGTPDRVRLAGEGIEVLAGGVETDRWRPERLSLTGSRPAEVRLEGGVPSRGRVAVVWLVRGSGPFTVEFLAEKADDLRLEGRLK